MEDRGWLNSILGVLLNDARIYARGIIKDMIVSALLLALGLALPVSAQAALRDPWKQR